MCLLLMTFQYNFIRKFPIFLEMFTGIVKLAQVDDYINPSQSCIQPKIMKQSQKPEKATVSLNDCLACSGCLTSAESVLIEQMSVAKLLSELKKQDTELVHFIVAPQVVLSISRAYKIAPKIVFAQMDAFLKKNFKTGYVLDLWEGIIHSQELTYRDLLEKKTKTMLCSQCPGWVCYAQKTLPQSVVSLLSKIKSPQQIMANILKERSKKCMVVSIMPCYDKKIEAIRFEVQSGIKQVDMTITTTEFLDLYQNVCNQKFSSSLEVIGCLSVDRLFEKNRQIAYRFVEDPVSNGYVEYLMKRMNGTEVRRKQIRNSDYIEVQFQSEGEVIKMAKCYGFRNIQKIVQAVKKGKYQYRFVQIMACPGGCNSGGGQIKVENIKPKELQQELSVLGKQLIQKTDSDCLIEELLSTKERFSTQYKVIQKSLSQSVTDW